MTLLPKTDHDIFLPLLHEESDGPTPELCDQVLDRI